MPPRVEAGINKELAQPTSELNEEHTSNLHRKNADPVTQHASSGQPGEEGARLQLNSNDEQDKSQALKESASEMTNEVGTMEEGMGKGEEAGTSTTSPNVEEEGAGSKEKHEQGLPTLSADSAQPHGKDAGQAGIEDGDDNQSTLSSEAAEGSTPDSLQDALEATEKSIMAVFHDLQGYTPESKESEAARKVIEAATAGVAAAIKSIHAAQEVATKVMIENEKVPGQELAHSLPADPSSAQKDPHYEARKALAAMQDGILKQSQQASTRATRLLEGHSTMEEDPHYESRQTLSQMQAEIMEQYHRASSMSRPDSLVAQQGHSHQTIEGQDDHDARPQGTNATSGVPLSEWRNGAELLAEMLSQEVGQLSPTQRLMGNDAVTKWHQEAAERRPGLGCTMEHAQRRDWRGPPKLDTLSPIHPIEQELSYHRSLHNAPPQQKTEVNFMMLVDGPPSEQPSQARLTQTGVPLKTMLRCTLDEEKSKNVSSAEPWETWSSQELRSHRL